MNIKLASVSLVEYNENHDEKGLFASGEGGSGSGGSGDVANMPQKQFVSKLRASKHFMEAKKLVEARHNIKIRLYTPSSGGSILQYRNPRDSTWKDRAHVGNPKGAHSWLKSYRF